MPSRLETPSQPDTKELFSVLEAIDSFLLPSEIQENLKDVAEAVQDQEDPLTAHFVNHEIEHKGESDTFSSFVLENAECEDGVTICFLDGVHTNEFLGGTAAAKLMKAMVARPEIMKRWGVKKFVYSHLNPEEMELNERSLLEDEMTVHDYIFKGYRSGTHPDWGAPDDPEDDVRSLETQRGIAVLDEYRPNFLFPLHNSGARTGAYVNLGPNTPDAVAQNISDFLSNAIGTSPSEMHQTATKKAPGIYDVSKFRFEYPDGRAYNNLGGYLRTIKPDSQNFTIEMPYFKVNSNDGNIEEITAVARDIEILVNRWREDLAELAVKDSYAAKMANPVHQYAPKRVDVKLEELRKAEFAVCEYRTNLIFYPAFMLGHASRAANSMLEGDSLHNDDRQRLLGFQNEAQTVLDNAVNEQLTPYLEVIDKTKLVKTELGAIALAIAQ